MDEIQKKIEMEYFNTYKIYSEYFAELDVSGIASFIAGSEAVLGSFETNPEDFQMEKLLFKARRRAIVTALLEHPAAKHLEGDMTTLAKLAEVSVPVGKETVH